MAAALGWPAPPTWLINNTGVRRRSMLTMALRRRTIGAQTNERSRPASSVGRKRRVSKTSVGAVLS